MKIILTLICLTALLSCSTETPQTLVIDKTSKNNKVVKVEIKENPTKTIGEVESSSIIKVTSHEIDGIEYRIFTICDMYDFGGIYVVNHTKELLEVELLKRQLK